MSNTTDAVMAGLIKFRISEDKDADVFEGRWNARRPKAFQVEKRILEEIKQFVVRGTKQNSPPEYLEEELEEAMSIFQDEEMTDDGWYIVEGFTWEFVNDEEQD